MHRFLVGRLFAALCVLTFAQTLPATAHAEDISDYLTGEIRHLDIIHGEVNLHDILLVSAFGENGKTVEKLADKKGKTLLLTFWSKNCLKCRRHLKELAEVQDSMGKDAVEIIAINMDPTPYSKIRRILDQRDLGSLGTYRDFNENIPARLISDPGLSFFGTEPKTLVIGPGGNVRAIANTRKKWNTPETIALFEALNDGRI